MLMEKGEGNGVGSYAEEWGKEVLVAMWKEVLVTIPWSGREMRKVEGGGGEHKLWHKPFSVILM